MLEAAPDIDRIEAQLLLFDAGVLPALFTGYTVFPRFFLEHNLKPLAVPPRIALPPQFELCRWAEPFYQPAGELIRMAYATHVDSNINDQYRSLHGSLRFLHNVIRFPGCGVFDPLVSFVIRERATNALIGLLLCSRIAPDVAHITQLCIAPDFRGRNLGAILLAHCMERLPAQHYSAITLTVSQANQPALCLYQAAGFTARHSFDALVFDKPPRRGFLKLLPRR
jgi:ribosomal protein S18 acetylase RimI-like enzyme